MTTRRTKFRETAAGILAGFVVTAAIGVTQYIAIGYTMGVRIGIDGSVQAVSNPGAPWLVGCAIAATAGLLFVARGEWWTPRLGRAIALAIVGATTGLGIAVFNVEYMMNFGLNPWWLVIPVEMSRSVASYAFLGLGVATLLLPHDYSRDADQSPPPGF